MPSNSTQLGANGKFLVDGFLRGRGDALTTMVLPPSRMVFLEDKKRKGHKAFWELNVHNIGASYVK